MPSNAAYLLYGKIPIPGWEIMYPETETSVRNKASFGSGPQCYPTRAPSPYLRAGGNATPRSWRSIAHKLVVLGQGCTFELREPRDFSEIRFKFGAATEGERGDAASGRDQICYTAPSGSVHLIFEFGEVNSVLYLFDGGPTRNGSELFAPSGSVSASLRLRAA
jgi:hypothetical protein